MIFLIIAANTKMNIKYLILAIALISLNGLYAQTIPFDTVNWTFEGNGVIPEYFEGQKSLYLKSSAAVLENAEFLNGIIEFDIYLKDLWTFSGFFFRMKDDLNYEELYFRPHQSGKPDAFQYCPRTNGKANWQLYHDQHKGVFTGDKAYYPKYGLMGFNGNLDYRFDRWMHVKLVVAGDQAELYFDNSNKPDYYIHELKMGQNRGPVGFYTGVGGVHFANFQLTENENQKLMTHPDLPELKEEDRIKTWKVSNAFSETDIKDVNHLEAGFLDRLKWKELESEANGVSNLSMMAIASIDSNTVLAALEIIADEEILHPFTFGYSDRVKVFCNGQAIYSGNNGYRSRDYRYLGTIGYFDTVYLPLKEGLNRIYFAVSESFGGWGIMGKTERGKIEIKE